MAKFKDVHLELNTPTPAGALIVGFKDASVLIRSGCFVVKYPYGISVYRIEHVNAFYFKD